jgi:hypothetical protein
MDYFPIRRAARQRESGVIHAGTDANEPLVAGCGSVGGAPVSVLRLIGFFPVWFQFGNGIADNMPGIARSSKMRPAAIALFGLLQD